MLVSAFALAFVLMALVATPSAAMGPRAQTVAPPPTTAPAQQPAQPTPPGGGGLRDRLPPPFGNGPSFIDIGPRVRDAVNSWFRDLAASALDPLLDLVSRTILATPDLTTASSRVHDLWWVSAGIANTCFVLLIVAGGVLVMSHETVQTSYGAKEIAPRLILGFLAANLSLFVAGQAIPLANALAQALLGSGADPDHVRTTLKTLALAPLDSSSGLLILIAIALAVMALLLVAAYVVRVSLLVVLIAGAPLALACHALPSIEGLAQLWWRAFTGCLGVQIGQALVLGMAVRVFFEADRDRVLGLGGSGHLVDLIVVGCLLWLLLRIPMWVSRLVFGRRGSTLVRLAKSYVIYRGVRSIGGRG